MPSLIEGYNDFTQLLSLTVTEKKNSRVRRAAKMKQMRGEESHVPRVPIIQASVVSGEQGGESPMNANIEIVSVRFISPNEVLRIRSSKQLQRMPYNIDRSSYRWIRKSK